jgi:hypothetical protein
MWVEMFWEAVMARVVIGMDPHKGSATIEVLDERERVPLKARFGTDRQGYRDLLAAGRRFPQRVWAVEGSEGVGQAQTPIPALRRSHFPDPPPGRLQPLLARTQTVLQAVPECPTSASTAAVVKRPLLDHGEDRRTLNRAGTTTS